MCVQHKNRRYRFFFKENKFGQFLKVSQIDLIKDEMKREANTIFLSLAAVYDLSEHLLYFKKICVRCPSKDGIIKSITLADGPRDYFLDLKQNGRGLFLRITVPTDTNTIYIPSDAILEIYMALENVIKCSRQSRM